MLSHLGLQIVSVDSYKTFVMVSNLAPEVDWLFAVSAENEVGVGEKAVTSKAIKLDKPISKSKVFDLLC